MCIQYMIMCSCSVPSARLIEGLNWHLVPCVRSVWVLALSSFLLRACGFPQSLFGVVPYSASTVTRNLSWSVSCCRPQLSHTPHTTQYMQHTHTHTARTISRCSYLKVKMKIVRTAFRMDVTTWNHSVAGACVVTLYFRNYLDWYKA